MAFKERIFTFLLILLIFFFVFSLAYAYEDEEPEDSMTMQDPAGENLSEKTDAELIGMEREIEGKLGKDPANPDLHYQLSAVYATLFDRTRTQKGSSSTEWLIKSRNSLEKTLMIRQDDKVAHYNLGVVYKRLGQMERAREELKKTIRLCDPQKDALLISGAWIQIGLVYEEQGFLDEAKEAYLQAREFDYGNEDIREAIRAVDAKRKAPESGGGPAQFGMPPMGNSNFMDPQTAAAMGKDPYAQNQDGLAQALPAIGQMLMQKFKGGSGGDDSGGQSE